MRILRTFGQDIDIFGFSTEGIWSSGLSGDGISNPAFSLRRMKFDRSVTLLLKRSTSPCRLGRAAGRNAA